MTAPTLPVQEVLDLVRAHATTVLDVRGEIVADARFAEDLHADSLDVVEIVEQVERSLRERGITVTIPEQEVMSLRTVRDVAEAIVTVAGR